MFRASIFASAAILALFPQIASAQCATNQVRTSVDCFGVIPDTLIAEENFFGIRVSNDAEFTSTRLGIDLRGFRSTVRLLGDVSAQGSFIKGGADQQNFLIQPGIHLGNDGTGRAVAGRDLVRSVGNNNTFLNISKNVTVTVGRSVLNAGDGRNVKIINSGIVRARHSFIAGNEAELTNNRSIISNNSAAIFGASSRIINNDVMNTRGRIEPAIEFSGLPTESKPDGVEVENHHQMAGGGTAITFKDGADKSASIRNFGFMIGQIGLLVEDAEGSDFSGETGVDIHNSGLLAGVSGPAFSLGSRNDVYYGATMSSLQGFVDFGGGDDKLVLSNDQLGKSFDEVYHQTFDGGDGFDTVEFGPDIMSSLIANVILHSESEVSFEVSAPGSKYTNLYRNFEEFRFSDRTLTMADFTGVTAVPLPAPALMLGAALAGLGGVARRSGGATARRA